MRDRVIKPVRGASLRCWRCPYGEI